ncbi:MAG: prepilin-type N-terminal cleavage/methylation domain-containing protein [Candidatus Sumerlaeota bacterium]|nr:prepilin-type N-terminal cleavage/methylation domain-containing protein [Candidatus Sumerlaeota bacterium]
MRGHRGFTLIELLIVIAIIAILALIAIPNFLEAQTRSKVARAQADMRSIATALEAYYVDMNSYPLTDPIFAAIPNSLSTPVSYITSGKLIDPFAVGIQEQKPKLGSPAISLYYTYNQIIDYNTYDALNKMYPAIYGNDFVIPEESVDDSFFNKGAFQKYGGWRMVSKGPDRVYSQPGSGPEFMTPLRGSDVIYDPSNGTISYGNIIRTQISPTGPKAIK